MKIQQLITGLIGSALMVFPGAAFAANQTPSGINTSGNPALVIDNIVCKGNDTTECDFITKKYYQAKGDVLDPSEIADAKLRLGTLIQFRDVDIHLEKGHKRGHVIVVFNITEASNIQYELGAGFTYQNTDGTSPSCYSYNAVQSCMSRTSHSKNLSLSSSITDFNFLGLGKRLSLDIGGSKSNNQFNADFEYTGEPLRSDRDLSQSIDGDSHGYNFKVDYYDPHLFDSSHYYLRTTVSRYNSSSGSRYVSNQADGVTQIDDSNRESSSMNWNMEVGRRFASHSFISMTTYKSFNNQTINQRNNEPEDRFSPDSGVTSWGVRYGWDSQDDTLFPTQGSVFSTNFNHSGSHGKNNTLSMNYLEHFGLTEQTILSLGGTVSASESSYRGFEEQSEQHWVHTQLSGKLTHINPIDPTNGHYSGWFTALDLSKANGSGSATDDLSIYLQAGYTHQTDSMIYRFSLGYATREKI